MSRDNSGLSVTSAMSRERSGLSAASGLGVMSRETSGLDTIDDWESYSNGSDCDSTSVPIRARRQGVCSLVDELSRTDSDSEESE